ncbi:ribosomal protein S18-alanine N-acetyltransferase [Marilutibacter alkalisoli]|uniref:[Ribosomal protein bS18]-alanine N-acetyltransferase n=1 Tax=Marilutibacter alkalisoli TaxID=2591633 RepID=A0A514BUB8_9GAMM|nr:ribosomal protein S18-alanine N-acetyltransferase [Lysobacter alkalisoli]QDH71008.1 ribosomal-protein-alanine N-acetyltransferase [Lysobacter alkalisoli]
MSARRQDVRPTDAVHPAASLRPMREADLDEVYEIELRAYPHPWTLGIFRDCLRADYPAWVLHEAGRIVGYFLMSLAAGEAHVLNICIDPERQGQGFGRRLLQALMHVARGRGVERIFLEVRPSNAGAIRLYEREGFNEIGRRPRYYPADDGREDALVMAIELLSPE